MAKNLQTKFSTRQYMLSRDFEIYYYNEPASEKVSIHSHDYYEFYFFLEGDVSIWIEGEQYPLKYGDMVLIPPGIKHMAMVHGNEIPYRRFVFWISVEYCNQLMEVSSSYGYLMQNVLVKKTAEKNHYRRILFYTRRNAHYHKTVLRERDIAIRIIP